MKEEMQLTAVIPEDILFLFFRAVELTR